MSDLLVIDRDDLHGDALMALPAICGLAERHDRVYLAMANRKILELADFPENVLDVMRLEPHWRNRSMQVQMLGAAAACNYDPIHSKMPLIHCLMAMAGLEVDRNVLPTPRIKVEPKPNWDYAPRYDVLLAPWTDARERCVSSADLRVLKDAMPTANWALVGGREDHAATNMAPPWWECGHPFDYLTFLMRRAKVVVTIDSFCSRLAHAAGVQRHIILDSTATPQYMQGHPGATFVRGRIHNGQAKWHVPDIVEAIQEALCTTTP